MNEKISSNMIYLDHNATTPIHSSARLEMLPCLEDNFGNPSSSYPLGQRAKLGVEKARKEAASLLGCHKENILFTSGGTESNNMVLKGVVDFRTPEKHHIITSAVEHPAILNPALFLLELGVAVTILPVDGAGLVDPDQVEKAIRPETVLISIMLANNETGALQPIREISEIAGRHGIPLHTDAAQAVGKMPVNVNALGVDFLSVAGHKLYGPKGVGVLYAKKMEVLTPLVHGAGQEFGKRAGTENVMLAAGLGAACSVAEREMEGHFKMLTQMRDRLEERLFENIQGLVLNGHPVKRLPNTLNVSVPGLEGAKILAGLPHIMASTGAACHDRSITLSHVLSAMQVPPEVGMGAIRLSAGRTNTMEQIEEASEQIIHRIREMRNGKRH